MKVVEEELMWNIKGVARVFMPARQVVEEAWSKKETFHPTGEFLYIEKPCPWKDHVFELEIDTKNTGLIKFVFYQDDRGMFRI